MKIVIAAEYRLMRDGLRAILQAAGFVVVGEAGTGHEAVARCIDQKPHVVLMEALLPELNGVDATRRLKTHRTEVLVLGLSTNNDPRQLTAMLAAGARGFLSRACPADELLDAIGVVASGRRYLSEGLGDLGDVRGRPGRRVGSGQPAEDYPFASLTLREREVLQLLAEGCSSKEIALQLRMAMATVETHRRQISEKLGVRGIARLTKWAIREGLTSIE